MNFLGTADPEWWPPNFAVLDPTEELRFLRARIAQLERQQTTNSPTSKMEMNNLSLKFLFSKSTKYKIEASRKRNCCEDLMKMELELKKVKDLVGSRKGNESAEGRADCKDGAVSETTAAEHGRVDQRTKGKR
uniref:Uncharacterized protein n=1 Tax=Globodera rostochiensis TaxID=31243 RepID=A0A914I8T1_GLORO